MKASIRVFAASFLSLVSAAQGQDAQAPVDVSAFTKPIVLACVGDSITAGNGVSKEKNYPAQLQNLLGADWKVLNCGKSGATLLQHGDRPYQAQKEFQKALQASPQVVLIMLGTNDTKPQNWKFKDQFVNDNKDLVEKFKALPTHPRIFLCLPVPVPGQGNYGINEAVTLEQQPLIKSVAQAENVSLIDLHSALAGKDHFYQDRVHPTAEGDAVIAQTVYQVLTGKKL